MLSFAISQILGYKVPVFGVSTQLEPTMVSNFRFFRRAEDVLNEGYQAVSLLGTFKTRCSHPKMTDICG